MDKGEANIDIVFRNGLKDYEALPPQEAWNSISPLIKAKSQSFLLFRAAAAIAVLVIISFFASKLNNEASIQPATGMISLNEAIMKPDVPMPFESIASLANIPDIALQDYQISKAENYKEEIIEAENGIITSPGITLLHETFPLSRYSVPMLNVLRLSVLNSSQNNVSLKTDTDLPYLPENVTPKSIDRWSIAAMASPTYYSKFTTGSNDVAKQMSASEQPLLSYSGGVAFTYKISKRLSVQSGLYYSSLGQKIDGINSFGGFQKYENTKGGRNFEVPTTSGTVYTNNGDVFLVAYGPGSRVITAYTNDVFDPKKASLQYLNNSLEQSFSYLELPVVFRYKIIDRAIDFNLIGGISYNMLVNNSVYTIVDGSKYSIGKTEGLNMFSLSSSLGMGLEYNLSNKLSLNMEPTLRYYLNPFNQSAGSIVHPYSFGIFSGLSYKF